MVIKNIPIRKDSCNLVVEKTEKCLVMTGKEGSKIEYNIILAFFEINMKVMVIFCPLKNLISASLISFQQVMKAAVMSDGGGLINNIYCLPMLSSWMEVSF